VRKLKVLMFALTVVPFVFWFMDYYTSLIAFSYGAVESNPLGFENSSKLGFYVFTLVSGATILMLVLAHDRLEYSLCVLLIAALWVLGIQHFNASIHNVQVIEKLGGGL